VREPRGFSEQRRRTRRNETPRPHRLNLRLGDDEKAAIEAAAALARLTPSSYAADVAVAVAMDRLTPIPTTYREELRELIDARAALTRIGSNLNQIARTLNSGGDVTQEQLEAVLERVGEAVRRVDEATIVNMRRRPSDSLSPVAAGGLRRPPDLRCGRHPPARSGIVMTTIVRAGGHRPSVTVAGLARMLRDRSPHPSRERGKLPQ